MNFYCLQFKEKLYGIVIRLKNYLIRYFLVILLIQCFFGNINFQYFLKAMKIKSKNRSHFFQFFLFAWHRVKIHERRKKYQRSRTFFNIFDKLLFFKESFFHNFTFHLKIIFLLHKVKIPERSKSPQKNEKFFNFFYNVLILNKYFHPSFYLSLMWKVCFLLPL